jgi:hypothetical protein
MTFLPNTAARRQRLLTTALLATYFGVACGEDLGQCDEQAALQLVYGRNGLVATKGQALLHDSCGNAAFCHSSSATGDNRFGAPAGMDFDMLPPTGWPEVVDMREEIWSAVDDGDMPPGERGKQVLGDGDWVFDQHRGKKAIHLPAVTTKDGKAALHNWLACGAPVVGHTQAPSWTQPSTDEDGGAGAGPSWTMVYQQVIQPNCALSGCHDAGGAKNSGGLDMSRLCGARDALLEKGCDGEPRVRPGDGGSLLIDKIESTQPRCGQRMPPPAGGLPGGAVTMVRAWVEGGADAPECK